MAQRITSPYIPRMNPFLVALQAALATSYRIDRDLGAGGMATVYLAHDIKHDRAVAIKVLKPELAASIGSERFLKEILTTANLQHPHIVPLYDSGDAGGPFARSESPRADQRWRFPQKIARPRTASRKFSKSMR